MLKKSVLNPPHNIDISGVAWGPHDGGIFELASKQKNARNSCIGFIGVLWHKPPSQVSIIACRESN